MLGQRRGAAYRRIELQASDRSGGTAGRTHLDEPVPSSRAHVVTNQEERQVVEESIDRNSLRQRFGGDTQSALRVGRAHRNREPQFRHGGIGHSGLHQQSSRVSNARRSQSYVAVHQIGSQW